MPIWAPCCPHPSFLCTHPTKHLPSLLSLYTCASWAVCGGKSRSHCGGWPFVSQPQLCHCGSPAILFFPWPCSLLILFGNLKLAPLPTDMASLLLADIPLTSCSSYPSPPPRFMLPPFPANLMHLPYVSFLEVTSLWHLWPYYLPPSLDFAYSCIFSLSILKKEL